MNTFFAATELATLAEISKDELESVVCETLERMVTCGLVHKAKESSEWYKDHAYKSTGETSTKRKTDSKLTNSFL